MKSRIPFLLCFIMLLASHQFSRGQNKVVNLNFTNTTSEKSITLRYSIQGLINYAHQPYIHKYTTESNRISFAIPDSIPFFMMDIDSSPQSNWGKNIIINMIGANEVSIYIDSVVPPKFKGKNAEAYNFVADLKMGTGTERSLSTLKTFLDDKSSDSFLEFINKRIATDIAYLDALVSNRDIDQESYSFTKNILVDDYLFRVGMIGLMTEDQYVAKIDSLTLYSDLDKIYKEHVVKPVGAISFGNKSMLRKMGLLTGEQLDLGLDYQYAESYLDKKEQESFMASELISSVAVGQIDSSALATRRGKFDEVFPNSKFISVINELKILENKDHYLATYSKEKGFEEMGRIEVDNLGKITGMFFGPKPVLVDFWATWCGPCLKEFEHKERLHEFLTENDIGLIYVSIDFPGAYDKWKEMINNKQLAGMHYFGTPEFADKLTYLKGSTIPRYILLDKNGNLLIENCKFPSSGELIPQLKEKLGL